MGAPACRRGSDRRADPVKVDLATVSRRPSAQAWTAAFSCRGCPSRAPRRRTLGWRERVGGPRQHRLGLRLGRFGLRRDRCAASDAARGSPSASSRCEMPRNVSNTPLPLRRHGLEVRHLCRRVQLRVQLVDASRRSAGRACCTGCTHGNLIELEPVLGEVGAAGSARLSLFSSILPTSLSATNTIASAPLSTSLRVAL